MTGEKDNGGSAFPMYLEYPNGNETHYGLTKREYFAAHAPVTLQDACDFIVDHNKNKSAKNTMFILAQMRLAYADAMIEEAKQCPVT